MSNALWHNLFALVCLVVDTNVGRMAVGAATAILALRRIRLMDETTYAPIRHTTSYIATAAMGYALLPTLEPAWTNCTSLALVATFLANWVATTRYWSRAVPHQLVKE